MRREKWLQHANRMILEDTSKANLKVSISNESIADNT